MSTLSKKKIIGITGSMGSGKSEVSRIVATLYPVVDCDQINAQLLEKGNLGYESLMKHGFPFFDKSGEIDKKKMAKAMFSDDKVKKQVEDILHPCIFSTLQEWIHQQEGTLVFVEMPLLFESESENLFDSIWCVVVEQDIALERLETYRHYSNEEAIARLQSQMSPQKKMEKSQIVIWNNGSMEELKKNVLEAIQKELV